MKVEDKELKLAELGGVSVVAGPPFAYVQSAGLFNGGGWSPYLETPHGLGQALFLLLQFPEVLCDFTVGSTSIDEPPMLASDYGGLIFNQAALLDSILRLNDIDPDVDT